MPKDDYRRERDSEMARRARGYRLPGEGGCMELTRPGVGGQNESANQHSRQKVKGPQKIVWELCNNDAQVVKVFEYSEKEMADVYAALLNAIGKGHHFVRPRRVPLQG